MAIVITTDEWDQIADRLRIPPRQVQIIQAIIIGHSKPEAIAQSLNISPSSVKTHTERLYQNLGVHNKVQVVVKVFEELLEMRQVTSVS